jgi:lipoprotein-anchoring transpeptidase ErfK/SrfK
MARLGTVVGGPSPLPPRRSERIGTAPAATVRDLPDLPSGPAVPVSASRSSAPVHPAGFLARIAQAVGERAVLAVTLGLAPGLFSPTAAHAESRAPVMARIDPSGLPSPRLKSPRFQRSKAFQQIALGQATLDPAARGDAAQMIRVTLFSLGYDGDGPSALLAFQRSKGLPEIGWVDAATLVELDRAAARQTDTLKAAAVAPGTKHAAYRIAVDMLKDRIYVIDKASGKPVARYLTSPGKAPHLTVGERFTIQRTLARKPWLPPDSPWARGMRKEPPGVENPMGLLKLDLGFEAQYFHGIPHAEERFLGQDASHGCLRMSGRNVLQFHELYAEAGTEVELVRTTAGSAALIAAADTAGVSDRSIDAGREYLAGYLSGELGQDEALKDGQTVVLP